jgi:hypothetical protein
MRMMVLAVVTAALAFPALANDSSAELRQGGLVLTRNAGVQMRSEDLYISPKAVRVRYRFLNTTPRDQSVLVAFPMPDITVDGIDQNISIPTENPENILNFSTRVEGKPVKARVEQKVFRGGVDRTALLRGLGVPLGPHLRSAGAALDRLPKATQARLVKLKLAVPEEYDVGKGMERHYQPTWTLKTTYYWDQVFPTGREIAVEHDYTPSVGSSAGTSVGADYSRNTPDARRMERRYCIDQNFTNAVERGKRAKKADYPPYFEQRIEYILSSGANWGAPIGDFRLVIDKGQADALVSFCGEGVRKIGPTQFEVRKTNFRPTSDLSILILTPTNYE